MTPWLTFTFEYLTFNFGEITFTFGEITSTLGDSRRFRVLDLGCSFFCLQLEAFRLQWSFLLTVDNFSFFAYSWSFFAYSFSFFTYSWSFFAYSGKVLPIRALRDCKQRSLTVSKKAPTVSKKASPVFFVAGRVVGRGAL